MAPLPRTQTQQRWALGLATLTFTLCFAHWMLLAIIGVHLQQAWELTYLQFSILLAAPILSGALTRPLLGYWTERYGGRRVFGLLMLIAATATGLLSLISHYPTLILVALVMGLSGGSFNVGLTYLEGWYSHEQQVRALNRFAAGNVGAALTLAGVPFLLLATSWQTVAQAYGAILALMGALFLCLGRDAPAINRQGQPAAALASYLAPLKAWRVWRFSFYYFFVFGAFVALCLWLPFYLVEVYQLPLTVAGLITALYATLASVLRIPGGWLSDRFGARTVMYSSLGVSLLACLLLSYPPADYVIHGLRGDIQFRMVIELPLFLTTLSLLGIAMAIGKAAVFSHIPLFYPGRLGTVGGVVGMIGGLGGAMLPLGFGLLLATTGVWQSAFMLLFVIAVVALTWMHHAIRTAERQEWRHQLHRRDLPERYEQACGGNTSPGPALKKA
ncbi:MAG: MFS transporter [Marinobacter sp.]|nr:MFS transporter [Marinobacter sp.]